MSIGNYILTAVVFIMLTVAVIAAGAGTMILIDAIYRLCVK